MTKSNRIGHWRTNKHGTTTWVTEHTVEKTVYTVSKNGSEKYVNGQKLLNTYCNYCYKKVFFISLNENKRLFNNDSEPLIVHKCRNRNTNNEVNDKPTQTKKFLDEDDLKALNRRGEALRQKSDLRKEEKRIKRDKKKAAKEQRKEKLKSQLDKAAKSQIQKVFFISGGKKQTQRLKKQEIGKVNKFLPRIIYDEIKSFMDLKQNKDSPYFQFNVTTNAGKKSKKRTLKLLSNVKKYSEILKESPDGNELSPKIIELMVLLEENFKSIATTELISKERTVLKKEEISKETKQNKAKPKRNNVEIIESVASKTFEVVKKRSLKSRKDIRTKNHAAAMKTLSINQTNDED